MDALIIEAGRTEAHYWRDLWRYRDLFYFLAWRDLLVRYKQTVFGVSLSADELNFIAAADIGATVRNFGFAGTYVDYSTSTVTGPVEHVSQPRVAFRPLSCEKSERVVELALALPRFRAIFPAAS